MKMLWGEFLRRTGSDKLRRAGFPLRCWLLAGLGALLGCSSVELPLAADAATPLSANTALYARVLRTAHNPDPAKNGRVIVSVTAFSGAVGEEDFYTGDQANGFQRLGSVQDASFAGGLCCGTLYELPSPVGNLAPGTLLWAGAVGQNAANVPMRLEMFASEDGGGSWRYLSDCATASGPPARVGGLWEPEFAMASDGGLVCFYSDETQPGHSQVIEQTRTYDGTHWSAPVPTVAFPAQAGRPGMPVVTQVPGGLYFMSYEACGTAACMVYSRTSADGWHWGDPSRPGTKVVDARGRFFEHAPTNAVVALGGGRLGLLLVGQVLMEANGSVSKENGQVVFLNGSSDGSGLWQSFSAPVAVPDAYDNYCPNYSSPLLPSPDGSRVLELASDYAGGVCRMFYGTGAVPGAAMAAPARDGRRSRAGE